jgi:hypothetical protein
MRLNSNTSQTDSTCSNHIDDHDENTSHSGNIRRDSGNTQRDSGNIQRDSGSIWRDSDDDKNKPVGQVRL